MNTTYDFHSQAVLARFPRPWFGAMLGTVATLCGLFFVPLFRIPFLGEVDYYGLYGCGPLQAWSSGGLLLAGLLLWPLRQWWLAIICGLAGSIVVLRSLAGFLLWLRGRLEEMALMGPIPGAGSSEVYWGAWVLGVGSTLGFLSWVLLGLWRVWSAKRDRNQSSASIPDEREIPG